jgi:hypothetical protein
VEATIKERCVQRGIQWEDNRSKRGAFWVLLLDRHKHAGFSHYLESHGFVFSERRGFYRKDGA